ncbi:MAG: hypothetical protein NZM06_06025, partial [Chloroherpetonaceae bacterium]|nr:hypothetical protein [Chloroherpetonaceae bacterium]
MKQIFLLTTLAWAMGASAQINPDAKTPLPDGVPASWWETVQKNIRESEYHIRPKGDGMFSSPNRAQNLRFTYFERGFSATR